MLRFVYAFELFVNKTNMTNEEKKSAKSTSAKTTIVTFIAANCATLRKSSTSNQNTYEADTLVYHSKHVRDRQQAKVYRRH